MFFTCSQAAAAAALVRYEASATSQPSAYSSGL